MSGTSSKRRPQWADLSEAVRDAVREVIGGVVVDAQSCPGGYSPGFASVLQLADGGRVFVKAMDLELWPDQGDAYRREIQVAGALSPEVPAPRLLASVQSESAVVLVFEAVEGAEPVHPWDRSELALVLPVLDLLSGVPSPDALPMTNERPRLGGWFEIAGDAVALASLETLSPWASTRIDALVEWEQRGMMAAGGRALTHFDLYNHNLLLTTSGTVIVDWPHARAAAAFVDTVMLLSTVPAAYNRERLWYERPVSAHVDRDDVTCVLAAHAGFCASGAVQSAAPGLEPISAAKAHLAVAALEWLKQRV